MVLRDQHPPPHPKAEQPKPRLTNMKTNYLCMPKFKSTTACGRKNHRLSPMTLLDRVREAVFRLIMLSALSKASQQSSSNRSSSSSSGGGGDYHAQRSCYYRPHDDPHHSEAVADCIEFIKKSATTDDYNYNRDSTASSSVDADTEPEVVAPVPYM